ncbi:MAG: hypothetical protein ACO3ST_10485 [Burkholderiaceae bacterium]
MNLVTCSDQDFACRMAQVDSCLMLYTTYKRGAHNENYQRFSERLHQAMGWRPDHTDRV